MEECAEDDWTFEVLEGSHLLFDDYMETNQCWMLSNKDVQWFTDQGCPRKRVPCPRGGMILWDSRLFHANARPREGRQNPGRWRFVVFVCMAPAWWAEQDDLETKQKAYDKLELTTHWPARGVQLFARNVNTRIYPADTGYVTSLPEVALSNEAKQLAGVLPYEDDGETDPNDLPEWR